MGTLEWLQKWYLEQCDGDWEHGYGVMGDGIVIVGLIAVMIFRF